METIKARPYAVIYYYSRGGNEQGDVVSTHKSHKLAEKKIGNDTFLGIKDIRDYIEPPEYSHNPMLRKYKERAKRVTPAMKQAAKKMAKKRIALRAKRKARRAKLNCNPAPLMYIITAQGTGKKMSYDGEKFSERAKIRLFKTVEDARKCAVDLIIKYPMLRKYRVKIETNEHKPGKI